MIVLIGGIAVSIGSILSIIAIVLLIGGFMEDHIRNLIDRVLH